jgi:hypothetical protein
VPGVVLAAVGGYARPVHENRAETALLLIALGQEQEGLQCGRAVPDFRRHAASIVPLFFNQLNTKIPEKALILQNWT